MDLVGGTRTGDYERTMSSQRGSSGGNSGIRILRLVSPEVVTWKVTKGSESGVVSSEDTKRDRREREGWRRTGSSTFCYLDGSRGKCVTTK